MILKKLDIDGIILIENQIFEDNRGFFMESYHEQKLKEMGFDHTFVQDNLVRSVKNVIRGLHYQEKIPQGKLVSVIRGLIFDIAVDIRPESPTFGQWVGEFLSDENMRQLYIPEGCAHGYCVLSDVADVHYKCTQTFKPEYDRGILWNDPYIKISWPVKNPILSEKDKTQLLFRQVFPKDV